MHGGIQIDGKSEYDGFVLTTSEYDIDRSSDGEEKCKRLEENPLSVGPYIHRKWIIIGDARDSGIVGSGMGTRYSQEVFVSAITISLYITSMFQHLQLQQ